MPTTQSKGDVSSGRPVEGAPALALVQSRAVPTRAQLSVARHATDENARRRSRIEDALAAGQLTICSECHGGIQTVAVFGELGLATTARVEDVLMAVEATDVQLIVLDLSGLTFMDSSGVHLIARADARCRAAAKPLRLLRGSPHIHRVFTFAAADTPPFAA